MYTIKEILKSYTSMHVIFMRIKNKYIMTFSFFNTMRNINPFIWWICRYLCNMEWHKETKPPRYLSICKFGGIYRYRTHLKSPVDEITSITFLCKTAIITVRKRSSRKVMFSQACIKTSVHRGGVPYPGRQRPPPRQTLPEGRHPP